MLPGLLITIDLPHLTVVLRQDHTVTFRAARFLRSHVGKPDLPAENTHIDPQEFFFFFRLGNSPDCFQQSCSVSLHHPSIDFAGEPSSGQPHSTRNVSTQRRWSLSWGNTTMVKWRRESSCCTSTQHTVIVAASSHILTPSWFFVETSNVSWGQTGCWWSICVAGRRCWQWPTSQHALPRRVTDLQSAWREANAHLLSESVVTDTCQGKLWY